MSDLVEVSYDGERRATEERRIPGPVHLSARRVSVAALVACLATGCAVGPNFVKPEPDVPPAYRSEVAPAEAASFADEPWFDVFQDVTLRGLIDEALAANYDLRTAGGTGRAGAAPGRRHAFGALPPGRLPGRGAARQELPRA